MKIAVLGGGPAGLYFAALHKRKRSADEVRVYEQNPKDVTWGFGVVFSDRALEFLREDDPEVCDQIRGGMETWRDITLCHRGESIPIDGVGFSAIGRLELLQILQRRAEAAGAVLESGRIVKTLDELGGVDLIVAADGVNSLARRLYEGDFGTSLSYLDNKFAWYGTTQRFKTLTLTFVRSKEGCFTAHHYRYSKTMSTFIVECDRATWERAGFPDMKPEEARRVCERVFSDTLGGHELVSNNTYWRVFPQIQNKRWFFKNVVLLGDALHTAHFTIGSGTRLAMEDAASLSRALTGEPSSVDAALRRYEADRRPILDKLVHAADASAGWHERFPEHMDLAPAEFAMSYITRSGRVDLDRLREMSPKFMAYYTARSTRRGGAP
jgi:2-polyprenyl-6-methoxyphenol hydroxylase-like FAD-dependent oxidoreductase